jgi:hypothetical protein
MLNRPFIGEWTKMLVDEQFRKCVTFLYADVTEQGVTNRIPIGSAFFVGVRLFDGADNPGHRVIYVVTPRHVIDVPADLWLRMRLKSDGYRDLPIDQRTWVWHRSSDVAIAAIPFSDAFDWRSIPFEVFADREFVEEHSVGEGDEVFFSGLFIGHYGRGAPQPIIRFGNVALMPREPVTVEISKNPRTMTDVEAYLVEARSWGGQSGSPAFLTFSADRYMGSGLMVGAMPPFALLGLVQGIWKDPKGAMAPDPSGEGIIEVNMGISVVIPAYTISEVLMSDEQKALRDTLAKQVKATAGSMVPPEAVRAEDKSEFERFEDLARNLVNTPKPSKEER